MNWGGHMMQFEYTALEALAAVIREGTFEAAAKTLHITQSAVSQRIKHLEERTGAVLIVRGRPCVATEYGQQLCRHVEQVQLLEHDLRKNLNAIDDPDATQPAVIRIAVNSDSLATWFPYVIKRAGAEFNINFDIIPDDQDYTAQRLRSGEALAAVTTSDKPLQGCRRVSLGAIEYLAVASPAYCEKYFKEGVTLESILNATHIVFDRKDQLPQQWMLAAFNQAPTLKGHFLPSFPGYMSCLLNGTGWGLMPRSSVEAKLADHSLVELVPGKTVMVSFHWQSSAQGSEIMRLLSSAVVDVARKHLIPDQYRS